MSDQSPLPCYPCLAAVPDPLASRSELRSWGLRPGGPPVASVTLRALVSGVRRQEALYRVAEAVRCDAAPTASRQAGAR